MKKRLLVRSGLLEGRIFWSEEAYWGEQAFFAHHSESVLNTYENKSLEAGLMLDMLRTFFLPLFSECFSVAGINNGDY